MSDMLRKLNNLSKKANAKNKELVFEFDFILDESNPKFSWNEEQWMDYAFKERQQGNKVIYLSSEISHEDY